MFGGIALVCLGLFAMAVTVRAFLEGEISMVWSLLGGWGTLSSRYARDESPTMFWATAVFYAVAGLLLAAYGAYRLIAAP